MSMEVKQFRAMKAHSCKDGCVRHYPMYGYRIVIACGNSLPGETLAKELNALSSWCGNSLPGETLAKELNALSSWCGPSASSDVWEFPSDGVNYGLACELLLKAGYVGIE